MSNQSARVAKLEGAILAPSSATFVVGLMSYDESGNPAELKLRDRPFPALPGETEDDLCARAMSEIGGQDALMLIQFVPAGPNGGLAPGFERFAKS